MTYLITILVVISLLFPTKTASYDSTTGSNSFVHINNFNDDLLAVRTKKTSLAGLEVYSKSYTKEEIQELIKHYAQAYNIDSALPLRIGMCESGYQWNAKNPRSTASGVYQYLSSTWKNTPEGKQGKSVLDPKANINAAIRHIATKGTSPWNASRKCWKV